MTFHSYNDNYIQIYKGDCIDILRQLNLDLEKVIFVSDPPFNIGYHYATYNDKKNETEYYEWLKSIFYPHKHVLIHYPENLYNYAIKTNSVPKKVVSWVYNSNTPRQHRDVAFFNLIPVFTQIGQPYKNPTDKRIKERILKGQMAKLYDWWNVNQVKNVSKDKTQHPAQMPEEIMNNIIGILPKGYTIVDPFMGSGTTAIACINNNVKFIGMEMDDLYYNISKNRIETKLCIL